MLAKYWRLRGVNSTGQIMTYADGARIAIRVSPWKIASGALSYGTAITEDLGFTTGTISSGGEVEGSVINNTSNLYLGVKGIINVTHDLAAADGTFYLYLEESEDNSLWPSDQLGFAVASHCKLVAALRVDHSSADDSSAMNFEF